MERLESKEVSAPSGAEGARSATGAALGAAAVEVVAKAITATARKLAILVYRMLRYKMSYRERSAADYDQLQRSRILRGLRKRAASLGFDLVDTRMGLVT